MCRHLNNIIKVRQYCAAIHDPCFLYHNMTMESDCKKASGIAGCLFTKYERERLDHLKQEIGSACSQYGELDNLDEQKMFRDVLDKMLSELTNEFDNCEKIDMTYKESFHILIIQVSQICQQIVKTIVDFQSPIVKPRWCDLTDAGPGVGISNFEVRFRDAELCQIYNSDYRIKLHRSRGDSGQGEAERTTPAVGDSIVDGSTIEWEKFKKFDGLSKEAVDRLTVQEFEQLEYERMQKNAWFVANLLVKRIDGAPVLGERIKAYLAEVKEKQFFFNEKYLMQYNSASNPSAKKDIPGANYFDKILRFFEAHYKVGELFMEYVKFGCASNICEFCVSWNGKPAERIPQPVPDTDRPYHYMHVSVTPKLTGKGTPRDADDWQPRANLKKLYNNGQISLQQQDRITEFCEKFYVKKKHVLTSIEHHTNLLEAKKIRDKRRVSEKICRLEKDCKDY